MPYTRNGDGEKNGEKMSRLVESMNSSQIAFSVFDGDTKDGSSLCLDNVIGKETIDLFNKVNAPTVYVLGDNEWTDCHRINNGSYDNLERLNYLRKTLFSNEYSFGQTKMKLQHQGLSSELYSENNLWTYGGLVFVGLNVSGSNNNKVNDGTCIQTNSHRTQIECDADNVEYQARDKANISFLHDAFTSAQNQKAAGIVVIIHADLNFDLLEGDDFNERIEQEFDGYNNFLTALIDETRKFNGQVLLVHGDSHTYTVDNPLENLDNPISNFTRLETFGSPYLNWVNVSVNTETKNVFTIQPVIVEKSVFGF
ncbi:MAG: hypothetical protein PHD53_01340 [Methylococcales bacterium]|nr:hypothetical protein [Methylococcales bacterium]